MSCLRKYSKLRDQLTILTERVASLIEHSATLMRKEKNLEHANEKVRFLLKQ